MDYHHITIDGHPCVLHPLPVWEAAGRDGTPVTFWGYANSVRIPVGMKPGSAFLLVTRAFYEAMDFNSAHTIVWTFNEGGSTKTLTLYNYVLRSADLVSLDGDEKACYFCEFRDKRQLLQNSKVLNVAYNLTIPKAPWTPASAQEWLDGTTDSGTPWTWQEVLDKLWAELDGAYAGTCPVLTWTPSHDPHNLRFYGVQAWDAIGELLECCSSTLAPTAAGFDLHELGKEQTSAVQEFDAIKTKLLWDGKPAWEVNYANCPETIRVLFPKREWDAGTVPPPHTWEQSAHHVDVDTEIEGASGVFPIWSDLPAEVDYEGAIVNTDDCDDAAEELAGKLAERLDLLTDLWDKQHSGYRSKPTLGPELHEILYRDYGDVDGFRTEFRSLWEMRWPERERQPHIGWLQPIPPGIYVAKVGEGGISARSGITLGSGTVDLYQVVDGDLESTSRSGTAYNLSEFAIDADTYVMVEQETITGQLMVAPGQGSGWYIGIVITGTIASGGSGTVEQCGDDPAQWTPTGVTFTVINPHDVDLEVDLHVRWTKYPGWSGWIVEPWDWTMC